MPVATPPYPLTHDWDIRFHQLTSGCIVGHIFCGCGYLISQKQGQWTRTVMITKISHLIAIQTCSTSKYIYINSQPVISKISWFFSINLLVMDCMFINSRPQIDYPKHATMFVEPQKDVKGDRNGSIRKFHKLMLVIYHLSIKVFDSGRRRILISKRWYKHTIDLLRSIIWNDHSINIPQNLCGKV